MKIIICGAGRVGLSIAAYLSRQENDVTVIDQDSALIKKISDSYDIKGVVGAASEPSVLKNAGADTADILIAVTDADEVNMIACQVGHSLFNISKKIARIRRNDYRDPAWSNLFSRNHMPIDVIISPEQEIANAIVNRMSVPGTTNDILLADQTLHLFGIIINQESNLVGSTIKEIDMMVRNIDFQVTLIFRDGQAIIPDPDFIIADADELFILTRRDCLFNLLLELGIDQTHKKTIVIAGGGVIGSAIVQQLKQAPRFASNRRVVIEQDIHQGRVLARECSKTLVLNGSALEKDILDEADVAHSSVFVSVMNSNENNILSAMLAKRMGTDYSIGLSTNRLYSQLLPDRIVDAIVNPEMITVSSILHYIRKGRIIAVHSLRDTQAEIIEAEVTDHCSIVNIPLEQVILPENVVIGAIFNPQTKEVKFPRKDTIIKPGDHVIILTMAQNIVQVEKLFSFSIDLF